MKRPVLDLFAPGNAADTTWPVDGYNRAFARNLGWLSGFEQQLLRRKRVAVAGLGGVGGSHALTLARLGVGQLTLADFDRFDIANLNRQAGAFASTLGRPKVAVIEHMLRDINPEIACQSFPDGIDAGNLDAFLDGADLFVDGLDFFALDIRAQVFARARELGIPAVTAAPLGMGVSWLVFLPDAGMSFERYFRLEGETPDRRALKFALGLAPAGFHRRYLVDASRLDLATRRAPSTAMACQLCSGVVGVEALKLLVGRGPVTPAPVWQHVDPWLGKSRRGRLVGGNANPLQRLKIALASRVTGRLARNATPESASVSDDPLLRILDRARHAPSGDNEQPWRFERRAGNCVRVHLLYRPGANIYEYADGRPILLAAGMLVETMALAAAGEGRACHWQPVPGRPWAIDVDLPRAGVAADPLADWIEARSVDRRPFRRGPLGAARQQALAQALGAEYELVWFEDTAARRAILKLNMAATRLRLVLPECREVHAAVIDHERDFSPRGLPARAVGLNPLVTRLMRHINASAWRTALVNRWLGGALMASVELDLRQCLGGAGHFLIRRRAGANPAGHEDWIAAGRKAQRFWLAATAAGLVLQPSFAPLIFASCAARGEAFSRQKGAMAKAQTIRRRFEALYGDPDRVVFLGRIGEPQALPPPARSLRLPLGELMQEPESEQASGAA